MMDIVKLTHFGKSWIFLGVHWKNTLYSVAAYTDPTPHVKKNKYDAKQRETSVHLFL